MRDVLRALATIGSLSSSQVNDAGFQDLVQDTRTSLSGAISAMAQDAGVLGNMQSSLTATQTQLADTQTALTAQVSSARGRRYGGDAVAAFAGADADAGVLPAHRRRLSGLSLVKFLPVMMKIRFGFIGR